MSEIARYNFDDFEQRPLFWGGSGPSIRSERVTTIPGGKQHHERADAQNRPHRQIGQAADSIYEEV
jgi:hypothetical protein